jgi:hypothetical protein
LQEWGNPQEEQYYEYIKSYSPFDNVKTQNYPNILVTAGTTFVLLFFPLVRIPSRSLRTCISSMCGDEDLVSTAGHIIRSPTFVL